SADAARIEREQAAGRRGIVTGGSTYGCVFTGGAANNLFSFAMINRPSGKGVLTAVSAFVVLAWVIVKCLTLTAIELVRFLRRVPEHGYDVYILSDHGQAHCVPFQTLTDGRPLEDLLFEEFFDPAGVREVSAERPRGRRLANGIKALRSHRGHGMLQRFVNYL